MVQYKITHSKVSDSEKLVEYLNYIGGETNFLSFDKEEFHFTIQEEKNLV